MGNSFRFACLKKLVITLFLLTITACGGGGGSEKTKATPVATISGTPVTSVNEGGAYSFIPVVSNFQSNALLFSIQNKPNWATFNSTTGELSGQPSYDDSGAYGEIVISATDGSNTKALTAFAIDVIHVNRLPILEAGNSLSLVELTEVNQLLNFIDLDGESVTVSVGELPSWLNYDSNSHILTGFPSINDSGLLSIEFIVSDGIEEAIINLNVVVDDVVVVSGNVIDGYISGATVYVDINNNMLPDEDEPKVTSQADGGYELHIPFNKVAELIVLPIRAYLGENAIDVSRPDIDYGQTPITLSLTPMKVTDVNIPINSVVLSPFSERLYERIDEQFQLLISGDITLEVFEAFVSETKAALVEQITEQLNINVDEYEEGHVENIIFNNFLQGNVARNELAELAQQFIDEIIISQDIRDFDGDGLANNVDPDDDNDLVNDTEDAFVFDASESVDSDLDGVGDNSDFYINDAQCALESDGDGEQCYLSWMASHDISNIVSAEGGDIYFYIASQDTLLRYSSNENQFVSRHSISELSTLVYSENHQRLYLGFNDGQISYIEDNELRDFVLLEQCMTGMADAGQYLVVRTCNGYGQYVTVDQNGNFLGESSDYYYTSRVTQWNSFNNRLYHFRDGVSPNDIHYTPINDDGHFERSVDSPYHGSYSIQGPISISSDGQKVLLGSGDIYNADDLTWAGSLNSTFISAFWLSDNELVTAHSQSGNTILSRRSSDFSIIENTKFDGNVIHTSALDDSGIVVHRTSDAIKISSYVPLDDSDHDGILNEDDDFPLDISASVDSDYDGYPDAWNEGFSSVDSSQNLVLDSFPLDSACWLIEHGIDGLCDYSATMPVFTPFKIVNDSEGNIYFLNTSEGKVYRWLLESESFGNPIRLGNQVTVNSEAPHNMAYSIEHERLYFGYSSGKITYVSLDTLGQEEFFASTAESVNGLVAVGNFVLAQDSSGPWNTHYVFGEAGQLTDSEDWNRYSRTYAWNEANDRIYFLRDGTSPNDLHYETIDQTVGLITEKGDSPYHSSAGISHPVKVSYDGSKVILGSGNIFDADTLTLIGSLGVHATDILWTKSVIISLEVNNDDSILKYWDIETYKLIGQELISGVPLSITATSEGAIVTTQSESGFVFKLIDVADNDADGMPSWWEVNFELNDNDAADAAIDSDNDGLSNLEEFLLQTNPQNNDSDSDGVNDGDEVNTHLSNPLHSDSDGDQLSDGLEINELGSNPNNTDTDEDGLTDFEEHSEHNTDLLSQDSDNDGLDDLYEITYELDPNTDDAQADADNDRLVNIDELIAGTNVNRSDSDSDGVTDGEEVHTYHTNPLARDSDADNISDGWEIQYGFDPLTNTDALLDADEDSFSNVNEFFMGTNPLESTSFPIAKAWTQYQGNSSHNGFIPININAEDLSLRWSVQLANISGGINPIVSDNGVLFVTNNIYYRSAYLLSIDASDGSTLWSKDFGENLYSISAPSLSQGKVYFQTDGNQATLHALDVNDSSEVFARMYNSQNERYKAPAIFENDLYVGGGTFGGIYKFSTDVGDELWFRESSQCDQWTPAVDKDYVYYFSNGLIKANKLTGEQESLIESTDVNYRCVTPVLGGQRDAFAIYDGSLVAYDLTNNKIRWQKLYNSPEHRYLGSPVVGLGKVYVLNNGNLNVIDQFSGELLHTWRPDNNQRLANNLVMTNNLLFVSDNINTYALNIETQEQVWSYPFSGSLSLSLDGALYISNDNGQIVAIDFGHDTDGDGIDDWWESRYGFDINNADDAELDFDDDGLSNLEEFESKTNPLLSDTDSDDLSDFDEINTHLSNPKSFDTDQDNVPDGWEVLYGLDLLSANDAFLDSDADGISNIDEYREQTDPTDETSIPDILVDFSQSFEDGSIPDDWVLDDNLPSSWGVTTLETTEGDYSIFSSGESAISFNAYFNGNQLLFDVSGQCSYSAYIEVKIDGERVYGKNINEWETVPINIPRGRHTISINANSCGAYLDNFRFTPLLDTFDLNVGFATVTSNELSLFDHDEQFIRSVYIPNAEYSSRDVSILDNGRIAVFNGVFDPSLSIYTPEHATWLHLEHENWSIINNSSYGGIAHLGNYVYVTDMQTSGDNSQGIIRFDLETNTSEFFSGLAYIDLTIGLDNFLYALSGRQVDKYDPDSMELLATFVVTETRALAVDAESNIYTASLSGSLKKYDMDGVEVDLFSVSLSGISNSFYDINITSNNELIFTNRNSQVLTIGTDFNNLVLKESTFRGNFISITPFIDEDLDGIPAWWETRFGLSDNDETDALVDLDGEGVTNLVEYQQNLDPSAADTDNDRLDDFVELNTYLTNPRAVDTDGDRLADGDEVLDHSTNPLEQDTDSDGFDDYSELYLYETDPNNESSLPDALTSLNIDFNDQLVPAIFIEPDTSTQAWLIETKSEEPDNYILRSGDIDDRQESSFEFTALFAQGEFSFDARVSSESCCDSLEVYIDDERVMTTVDSEWVNYQLNILSGEHTIRFRYEKDGSVSRNEDAAFIDNIIFITD